MRAVDELLATVAGRQRGELIGLLLDRRLSFAALFAKQQLCPSSVQ
jgi:hypothetical protein